MDAQTILEALTGRGLEHFKRFYTLYRAVVTRNDDPEGRGRIQAHCPAVGQAQAPNVWIDCALPGAGAGRGMFWPPEIGDGVFLAFENGQTGAPRCYVGGWYGKGEVPPELASNQKKYPERRGFVTRMGHSLIFDDTAGAEAVKLTWHRPAGDDKAKTDRSLSAARGRGEQATITFSKDGAITIEDKNGSTVSMDTVGKKVVVQFEKDSKLTLQNGMVEVDAKRINHGAGATEAHMRGTTYRRAEVVMNSTLRTNFQAIGGMCNAVGLLMLKAGTSPLLVALAGDAAVALGSAAAIFQAMGAQFQSAAAAISGFEGQSGTYLSPVSYTK